MLAFILALVSWSFDQADAKIIDYYVKAVASDSQTEKYVALSHGLMAIDARCYSRARVDTIALLYGSMLIQNVPSLTKTHIIRTLTKMDGLDSSIDVLLRMAGMLKATAVAKKQAEQTVFKAGSRFLEFPTGRLLSDDEKLADDLIASLWNKKSGGKSHFSGGFSPHPRL